MKMTKAEKRLLVDIYATIYAEAADHARAAHAAMVEARTYSGYDVAPAADMARTIRTDKVAIKRGYEERVSEELERPVDISDPVGLYIAESIDDLVETVYQNHLVDVTVGAELWPGLAPTSIPTTRRGIRKLVAKRVDQLDRRLTDLGRAAHPRRAPRRSTTVALPGT